MHGNIKKETDTDTEKISTMISWGLVISVHYPTSWSSNLEPSLEPNYLDTILDTLLVPSKKPTESKKKYEIWKL